MASPSTAEATVQIDVRGSLMRCFFTGYTFQAEVIGTPAEGGARPPAAGTLHVTLGEGPLDPMALGGVFRAKARAVPPLASGSCAAPAMALDPDRQGLCWALLDASPSPAP